jgi:hypothetical protein
MERLAVLQHAHISLHIVSSFIAAARASYIMNVAAEVFVTSVPVDFAVDRVNHLEDHRVFRLRDVVGTVL